MDRKNYNTRVIAVFDTIGTFFTDVFYNGHYIFALNIVKEGRGKSITDTYKDTIRNYIAGISRRPDLYSGVIKKLHEYYQRSSGFGTITFSEFEDKILSQFIPREYYISFTEKNKDDTLHDIIVPAVGELGVFILRPNILRRVVDDHMNTANVELLQNRIVDIFILARESYYSKFARAAQPGAGQTVPKDVVEKLKDAFVSEKKLRQKAENDRDRAVNIISQLVQRISVLEAAPAAVAPLPAPLPAPTVPPPAPQPSRRVIVRRPPQPLSRSISPPPPAAENIDDAAEPDPVIESALESPDSPPIAQDSDDDDEEEDDEAVHRRQREAIMRRRRPPKPSSAEVLGLDDDPGFG